MALVGKAGAGRRLGEGDAGKDQPSREAQSRFEIDGLIEPLAGQRATVGALDAPARRVGQGDLFP